jgi:transposase-like protein
VKALTEAAKRRRSRKGKATYTFAFKIEALRLALRLSSFKAAANTLKIPVANLQNWNALQQKGALVDRPKKRRVGKLRARRVYPAEFKFELVQQARVGGNVSATAKESGVPLQTLHNWMNAEAAGRLGTRVVFSPGEVEEMRAACATAMRELEKLGQKKKHRLAILQGCVSKLIHAG